MFQMLCIIFANIVGNSCRQFSVGTTETIDGLFLVAHIYRVQ